MTTQCGKDCTDAAPRDKPAPGAKTSVAGQKMTVGQRVREASYAPNGDGPPRDIPAR